MHFWCPLFAFGEKGALKKGKYRSAEGESPGKMNDRVPRVHDTHMRNGYIETVLSV